MINYYFTVAEETVNVSIIISSKTIINFTINILNISKYLIVYRTSHKSLYYIIISYYKWWCNLFFRFSGYV